MQAQIDKLQSDSKLFVIVENIDIDTSTDLARHYGIRSIPTLIKLDGDIEIGRSVGAISTDKLLEFLS
jgi:thioredoxin-like negative regulator of GroEL